MQPDTRMDAVYDTGFEGRLKLGRLSVWLAIANASKTGKAIASFH